MSVIGRLDEQVDEILIAPVQRKKNQETNERNDEQLPSDETPQIESNPSTKGRAEREELPVWLL